MKNEHQIAMHDIEDVLQASKTAVERLTTVCRILQRPELSRRSLRVIVEHRLTEVIRVGRGHDQVLGAAVSAEGSN
jgi:hypothetical protein